MQESFKVDNLSWARRVMKGLISLLGCSRHCVIHASKRTLYHLRDKRYSKWKEWIGTMAASSYSPNFKKMELAEALKSKWLDSSPWEISGIKMKVVNKFMILLCSPLITHEQHLEITLHTYHTKLTWLLSPPQRWSVDDNSYPQKTLVSCWTYMQNKLQEENYLYICTGELRKKETPCQQSSIVNQSSPYHKPHSKRGSAGKQTSPITPFLAYL